MGENKRLSGPTVYDVNAQATQGRSDKKGKVIPKIICKYSLRLTYLPFHHTIYLLQLNQGNSSNHVIPSLETNRNYTSDIQRKQPIKVSKGLL